MSDWIDDITPHEREQWDAWVYHVRRDTVGKIAESSFVLSLVPGKKVDVKFAVELGLAIMLDKPIVAIVAPRQAVPWRLTLVCDRIVRADIDTEEGQAELKRVFEEME